jgi:hypothetical protein
VAELGEQVMAEPLLPAGPLGGTAPALQADVGADQEDGGLKLRGEVRGDVLVIAGEGLVIGKRVVSGVAEREDAEVVAVAQDEPGERVPGQGRDLAGPGLLVAQDPPGQVGAGSGPPRRAFGSVKNVHASP